VSALDWLALLGFVSGAVLVVVGLVDYLRRDR
jgi:hypothetical protein